MADRRFSFMDPLVLAIAAGEKDVTRRLVNMAWFDYIGPRDAENDPASWGRADAYGDYWYLQSPPDSPNMDMRRPYYPGDTLAVCEALVRRDLDYEALGPVDWTVYRADGKSAACGWPWKVRVLPARYCPAWAVRYRRRILSVRPERLTSITDDEVRREGVTRLGWEPTATAFVDGFRKMHGLDADADPWVWRVEFEQEDAR